MLRRKARILAESLAPIRVLIVHRYRSVLWGIERLVECAKSSMHVVGAVKTLAEALACLETAKPDVILLAHIDDELGLDAIPRISAVSQAKVLVFIGAREMSLREAAILNGTRGGRGKGR